MFRVASVMRSLETDFNSEDDTRIQFEGSQVSWVQSGSDIQDGIVSQEAVEGGDYCTEGRRQLQADAM